MRGLFCSYCAALMLFLVGCSAGSPTAQSAPSADALGQAATLCRAYFERLQAGDLERTEALFLPQSSVFEGGKSEGTFSHYAAHHLGPELREATFAFDLAAPTLQASEDLSLVVAMWTLTYRVELRDGRAFRSEATVTFTLRADADSYRIEHLHWSSRRLKEGGDAQRLPDGAGAP
jgi:hypothetical protein